MIPLHCHHFFSSLISWSEQKGKGGKKAHCTFLGWDVCFFSSFISVLILMPILIPILEDRLFLRIICLENCSEIFTDADLRGHFKLSIITKDAGLDHSGTESQLPHSGFLKGDFLCQVCLCTWPLVQGLAGIIEAVNPSFASETFCFQPTMLVLRTLIKRSLTEILHLFPSLRDFLHVVLHLCSRGVGVGERGEFANKHSSRSYHCWHLWLIWSVSSCS